MIRILFVDDDRSVLMSLRRSLRAMRRQWQMRFANSGPEALRLLDQTAFDVVATDLAMPGIDGRELLRRTRSLQPWTVRFALCSRTLPPQEDGAVHACIGKPYDAQLQWAIHQVSTLVRAYRHPGLREIADGVQHATPLLCAARCGPDARLDLELATATYASFPDLSPLLDTGLLAERGVLAAELAGRIAPAHARHAAQLGAFLHDIGLAWLAARSPAKFLLSQQYARRAGGTLSTAQHAILGFTSAELGAYLVGTWGLPPDVARSVAFQQRPREAGDPSFGAVGAVHVATAMARRALPSTPPDPVALDVAYVEEMAGPEALSRWHALPMADLVLT